MGAPIACAPRMSQVCSNLIVRALHGSLPGQQPVEVVERKGRGHPDTICDAISERISARLCQYYRDKFGMILHHNVDKVLLAGGASRARFGGGEVLQPMEIFLAGRATDSWCGEKIPVDEIAIDACEDVLRGAVPDLELTRHVRITPRIRHGSSDLTRLFARGSESALANDTSCGAGFAPSTDLERVVLQVERRLTDEQTRRSFRGVGSDIKVMGIRRDDRIALTVGCAIIGRHVQDLAEYARLKDALVALIVDTAKGVSSLQVDATVNAGDDLDAGDVFLTVTGTSAESGDDGETGRGNRVNGLITPYRPMTLEAAAGKNPVNHVGKLYNVIAQRICSTLVEQLPDVSSSTCRMVSRIGWPVDSPQVVDIELALHPGRDADDLRADVEAIVTSQLERVSQVRDELVAQRITVF